jgi:hypothetical protein
VNRVLLTILVLPLPDSDPANRQPYARVPRRLPAGVGNRGLGRLADLPCIFASRHPLNYRTRCYSYAYVLLREGA